MPAREARAPWARPDLKAMLAGSLPQSEVAWMSLPWIDLAPGAGEQFVDAVPREPAVSGEAGDVVVDSAADLVGVSLLDQLCDQFDHLRDVVGRVWVEGRGPDVDARGILHERVRVESGNFLRRLFLQARGDEHLVLASVE